MSLADMLNADEPALVCDLAEIYHIYDYKSLPLRKVATFSVGLRDDSRIKMKMNGLKYSLRDTLLAAIADRLALLVWMSSEDGQKNTNRPKSILNSMLGETEESDNMSFDTPEEYEKARKEIIEGSER